MSNIIEMENPNLKKEREKASWQRIARMVDDSNNRLNLIITQYIEKAEEWERSLNTLELIKSPPREKNVIDFKQSANIINTHKRLNQQYKEWVDKLIDNYYLGDRDAIMTYKKFSSIEPTCKELNRGDDFIKLIRELEKQTYLHLPMDNMQPRQIANEMKTFLEVAKSIFDRMRKICGEQTA